MKYALLRAPHPNARYEASLDILCQAETARLLSAFGVQAGLEYENIGGLKALTFCCELNERLQQALYTLSSLYALAGAGPNGELYPLMEGAPARPFYDLPAILKYKGKTNENFTRFLINMALFSSAAASRFDEPLTLWDPMCGRGTTLFCALGRGYHACGGDLDERALKEASAFFKSYLRTGRFKHEVRRHSQTVGKQAVAVEEFVTAASPEAYREGRTLTLALAACDGASFARAFKKRPADLVVCDLPYGVQHSGDAGKRGSDLEKTLRRVLPVWKEGMKQGGVLALSFNSYTLPRERVRELMQEAGLAPFAGGEYDTLCHWVEQAVLRDAAFAVKA